MPVDLTNKQTNIIHLQSHMMRRESALVKIFGSNCMKIAISRECLSSKSKYVDRAYDSLSIQTLQKRFSKQQLRENLFKPMFFEKRAPPSRVETPSLVVANLGGHRHRLDVCGDFRVIVNWPNRVWPV
jgi:hypothetical protein